MWFAIACVKTSLPGRSFQGPLPAADERLLASAARVDAVIRALATDIGPRSCVEQPEALARAADLIEERWEEQGYAVERQPVAADCATANLVVTLPGADPALAPLVVGAHYDTWWYTPGADDNASGVAALFELTGSMVYDEPARTILFVAWTTEEPPFFARPSMGSYQHAQSVGEVFAALSLETLGQYSEERRSQRYPFPLSLAYPSTGNFVAFVADRRSRHLLNQVGRVFRETEDFPTRGGAAPRWITGVDWSDHRSYWAIGAPALMITDTALFRNPNYHRLGDLPDKLDPLAIARVCRGLLAVVRDLAG